MWATRRLLTALGAAATLALLSSGLVASERNSLRKVSDTGHGSDLMSAGERAEYRQRLSTAKTDEERRKLRDEYQQRMRERARQKGMLPSAPSAADGRDRSKR